MITNYLISHGYRGIVVCYTEDRKSHPYDMIREMERNWDNKYFDSVVAYNDQTRSLHTAGA